MDIIGNLIKHVDLADVAQKFGFDTEEVQKIVGALSNNEEVKKAMPGLAKEGLAQQQKQAAEAGAEAQDEPDLKEAVSGLNLESIFASLSKDTGVDKEKLSAGGSGLLGTILSKAMGGQGGSLLSAENLSAMLDKDGDGKIVDDLFDMAKNMVFKKS